MVLIVLKVLTSMRHYIFSHITDITSVRYRLNIKQVNNNDCTECCFDKNTAGYISVVCGNKLNTIPRNKHPLYIRLVCCNKRGRLRVADG